MQLQDVLIVAIVLIPAIFIIVRGILKMKKGQVGCGGCGGCSEAQRCDKAKKGG